MKTTHHSHRLFCLTLFSIILVSHLTPNLSALTISFDDYATGALDGQPTTGTQWSGGGNDFLITSEAGFDGGQAVVTSNRSSSNAHSMFTPSEFDLPDFDGSSSILQVSFQFRYDSLPDTNTTTVAAIQFGYDGGDTTNAARFYMRSDGRIGYNNGTSPQVLISDLQINDTTTWTTISAILNYETETYTFMVNGTPYSTVGGNSTFGFRGETQAATIRLLNSGSANHKSLVFDNISISTIPEPSTLGILSLGLLLSAAIVRRYR